MDCAQWVLLTHPRLPISATGRCFPVPQHGAGNSQDLGPSQSCCIVIDGYQWLAVTLKGDKEGFRKICSTVATALLVHE